MKHFLISFVFSIAIINCGAENNRENISYTPPKDSLSKTDGGTTNSNGRLTENIEEENRAEKLYEEQTFKNQTGSGLNVGFSFYSKDGHLLSELSRIYKETFAVKVCLGDQDVRLQKAEVFTCCSNPIENADLTPLSDQCWYLDGVRFGNKKWSLRVELSDGSKGKFHIEPLQ